MTHASEQPLNIAIVGSGISGICTAYLLQKAHRVTLYEQNDYFGGHTNTVIIPDGPDEGTPVDTGFIVLNERTYPNFLTFLRQLGVNTRSTDMSFSYHCKKTGLCYASQNLNTLFAQRGNLFRPRYWRFVREIVRFLNELKSDWREGRLEPLTLGEYLEGGGYHEEVIEQFVIPMAAAIWSGSDLQMKGFPIRTFAQFYDNHGLLSVSQHPPWYFVDGGSHTYVKAFLKSFQGRAIKNAPIKAVKRSDSHVTLTFADGHSAGFDAVVIATHADQALSLLEDPDDDEKRLLGAWGYSVNTTVLHTSPSFMPPTRRAWASWNYTREASGESDSSPVTVTYDMNRLQKLTTQRSYFVTLNPQTPIPPETVIMQTDYTHPQYSFDALETQGELAALNGKRNTFFCGSYFGYGFHEDGVNSALAVGRHFGLGL